MMNIRKYEEKLVEIEAQFGKESEQYANCLHAYGTFLKSQKMDLLRAANMIAQAEVIHNSILPTNHSSESSIRLSPGQAATSLPNSSQTPNSTNNQSTDDHVGTKACPLCAETIKAAAVKCKHCGSFLNKTSDFAKLPIRTSTTTDHLLLIEDEVEIPRKDAGIAIILGILFGLFGIHKFYLGEYAAGTKYLLFTFIFCFIPPLLALEVIFLLIDLVTTPGHVKRLNLSRKGMAALRLANSAMTTGDYEAALQSGNTALSIAKKIGDVEAIEAAEKFCDYVRSMCGTQ